eukprot:COSAG02_NODE_1149_length_14210_cov_40.850542_4_plen_83_part_00
MARFYGIRAKETGQNLKRGGARPGAAGGTRRDKQPAAAGGDRQPRQPGGSSGSARKQVRNGSSWAEQRIDEIPKDESGKDKN